MLHFNVKKLSKTWPEHPFSVKAIQKMYNLTPKHKYEGIIVFT